MGNSIKSVAITNEAKEQMVLVDESGNLIERDLAKPWLEPRNIDMTEADYVCATSDNKYLIIGKKSNYSSFLLESNQNGQKWSSENDYPINTMKHCKDNKLMFVGKSCGW